MMKPKSFTPLATLLALLGVTVIHAAPTADELLQQAIRFPVIAVPLVEKEPVIDGAIGDDEWAGASVVSDLIYDSQNTSQRCGVAAQHRSRYFIQYTKEAIFVAARYDVPEYVGGPATSDVWANQDAADIFLVPIGKFQSHEKWHVSGAASGKYWGRDLAHNAAPMDNAKMKYGARIIPGGWEMEYRLPFTEVLDTPTPTPGELWRANFVAVRRTPIPSVSAWSYWARWRQTAVGTRDGWLVFTGKPVGVRFDHGALNLTREGTTISLSGTVPDSVEVVAQLYKRKEQPKPSDPGSIAKLGDMLDNTTVGGSNTYGMKFADVVASILKEFDPVGAPIQKKLSATDKSVSIKATDLGEYLLTYQVVATEGDKKLVLGAGGLPMRVEPPVSVAANSFELEHGLRRFDVDFSTMPTLAEAKKVSVSISPAAGGKPVAKQIVDAGKGFSQVELKSKDWPAAQYVAKTEVLDGTAKVLGAAETKFEKKPLPNWFTKPEGFEPEVPEPWKPVQAKVSGKKTAEVNVLGRTYTFAGPSLVSALSTPSRLSKAEQPHKPIEILSGPVQFAVTAGGKTASWATKDLKLVSKKPSEIVLVSENVAEGLVLKAKTKVEFDGMIRVDFSLASSGTTPTKIDKLDLVIPYDGKVAEMMSNYRKAPGPGSITGRYIGKVPTNTWKYAVFYTHFLGNSKVGMEWFCDSMKGWRLKKPDEAVEVARVGDKVIATYHMVDHEVTLDKPIEITFGLIATPTKPVPLGADILRFDQQAYLPSLPGDKLEGGKVATQADTDAWIRRMQYARVKVNLMFGWNWSGVDWFQYPVAARPELKDRLKKQFDIVHSTGAKMCPWGSWYCIPTSIPEWDLWGAEMVVQPMRSDLGKSFSACYNSPFTDFLVGNFAANARDIGIDGMRHDTIAPPVECQSEYHGCGWRDHNGKLWPSQNLFATREYFKRLYRVFHGGVRKNGICYFPLAGPPINCIDSFVDIHEIGEGNFERAATLKEGYPQEDVRVRHTGTAYGFVTSSNLKGHPLHAVERMAALFVAGSNPRLAFAGNPHYIYRGYQYVYQRTPNIVETWNAWEWIDVGNTSIWKPYWENADLMSLKVVGRVPSRGDASSPTPAVGSGPTTTGMPELYGSFYYIPGKRVLLIVTNYEKEPLAGLVAKLDLKKLGFKGKETLYGEDAVTQEFVEVKDGAVSLDIFGQRYRMIKISADKPKLHPDNLGENVFAAGAVDDPKGLPGIIVIPPGQTEPFLKCDSTTKRSGAASLQMEKMKPVGNGYAEFPPCPVAPGWYTLSGYIRLDKDLGLTMENVTNPRPDYTFANVAIVGDGMQYDPPAEFCWGVSAFQIAERTPGWQKFTIPFQASEQTKQVKVGVTLHGVGVVNVDDLEIRPIKKP